MSSPRSRSASVGREYGWRYRRQGYVVGSKGDSNKFWSPEEYVRLMAMSHSEGAERLARDALLRRGYQGDREALEELRTRFRLRLPMVEERIRRIANIEL